MVRLTTLLIQSHTLTKMGQNPTSRLGLTPSLTEETSTASPTSSSPSSSSAPIKAPTKLFCFLLCSYTLLYTYFAHNVVSVYGKYSSICSTLLSHTCGSQQRGHLSLARVLIFLQWNYERHSDVNSHLRPLYELSGLVRMIMRSRLRLIGRCFTLRTFSFVTARWEED